MNVIADKNSGFSYFKDIIGGEDGTVALPFARIEEGILGPSQVED